jgi:hypothetical protein
MHTPPSAADRMFQRHWRALPRSSNRTGYQVWATSARRRCSGDQTGFNTIKLDVSDGLGLAANWPSA